METQPQFEAHEIAEPAPVATGAWAVLRSAGASLLVGAVCFAAAIPLGSFPTETVEMGRDFEAMSSDPLGGNGPHPERFLTPLLAWSIGLTGSRYWAFSQVMLITFLALVHRLAVTRSGNQAWACVFTLGLSASGIVTVYREMPGYSDPTTFCLVCLCLRFCHRRALFWSLLALCALNHGHSLLLWPWLAFERSRVARLGWRDALFAAGVLLAYPVARSVVTNHGAATHGRRLTLSSYLGTFDWSRTLEFWTFLVPGVVFSFGFLLVVLWWDLLGQRRREAAIRYALVLGVIAVSLMFATDTFRFTALLGLPMIAAVHRRVVPDRRAVVVLTLAVGATIVATPGQLQALRFLMDRIVEFTLEGHRSPVLSGLLPRYWPFLLAYPVFVALLAPIALWSLPRPNRRRDPA